MSICQVGWYSEYQIQINYGLDWSFKRINSFKIVLHTLYFVFIFRCWRFASLYLPIFTYIYLYLPIFTYIYLYLPISTYIYLYLPISTCIYLYLPVFTCIYLYLPVFTCIYLLFWVRVLQCHCCDWRPQ